MRFLFVDKITNRSDTEINGVKLFAGDSPFRILSQNETAVIASGVVGEAIGQLVSWLVIEQKAFRYRPVYAFSDKVEILGNVRPGTQIEIFGRINQMDDESVVFSGHAQADGEIVQRVTRCTNYFMPLEQTEFEADSRERFAKITSAEGGFLDDGGSPYNFQNLVTTYEASATEDKKKITAYCQVPIDAPFFVDHFPKFPVTPIVVINEIIGLAIQRLATHDDSSRHRVRPKEVRNLKIKSFICPGEKFEIVVQPKAMGQNAGDVIVTVTKEGKKILQGIYTFSGQEE